MTSLNSRVSLSQLEAMRAAFIELPPKPKTQFSNRDAIAELAAQIRHAREKLGYSLADIAVLLQPHGLEIAPNTLRGYLRDLEKKAERAKAAKTAPRTSRVKCAVPAAPVPEANPQRPAASGIVFVDLAEEDELFGPRMKEMPDG